jgi:cytoskeletal protein CcmA (bactofilin family)
MSILGRTLVIKGEVHASADLTIEGRIEGPVLAEDVAVIVAQTASIQGEVIARDITVFGTAAGQLVATDVVDIRSDATVTGQVLSKRFILDGGAHFQGRVEPQHLEAALRVAKFNQKKRDPN